MTATKEVLSNSDIRYKFLMDSIPDVIGEIDLDGTINFISSQVYGMLGYHPDEMNGTNFIKYIHPDDVMLIAEAMKKAIKTKEDVAVPSFRLIHKNGDIIYATVHGKLVNLDGNEKFIVAIRDESKSKYLEKEVQFEKENLINILRSMEDGVYIVDHNYDIEYVNPILTEEFGPYKGKKCYNYFHDRKEICPWCKNQEVFKGKTVRWEWHSEKNQKTYDLIDTPLKNMDGSISKLEIFRDITERKKAEQKLKESEERLKKFMDSATDGFVLFDSELNYVDVNEVLQQIVGRCREELIGKNILDILPHLKGTERYDKYLDVINTGIPFSTEDVIYNRLDGSLSFYLSVRAFKVSNGLGIIFTDISTHKKVEEKIKESEQKLLKQNLFLNSIIESLTYPFIVINVKDYTISLANTAASSEGISQKSFCYSLNHNRNKPCEDDCVCPLKEVVRTKNNVKVEHTHYNQRGEAIIYEVQGYPVLDESDNVVQLIEFSFDITERKKVEQELVSAKNELSTIYEKTPLIVILVDSKRRVLKANKLAEEFAGRSEGEMLGLRGGEALRCLHSLDDSRGCGFGPFCQTCNVRNVVLDTFETNLGKSNVETSLPFKIDGKEQELFFLVSTVPIDFDEEKMVIVTINDITEHKKIEEKLKESEEDYRLITENANDIIAVLDDKFRLEYINETPLNKLLGYSGVDYIGKSEFLVIHPDDRKMVLNGLLKGFEVGKGRSDARLKHKDGHYIWVESRGKTFFDRNGEKKILINIRNITDRKKAEQQHIESEEKYRSLFDNLLEGAAFCKIITNENNIPVDFLYLEINDSFERLTGLKKEETVGKRVTEVIPGIEDSEPNLFEIYGKVALTGENTKFEIFFEPLKIWFSISVYSPKKEYFVAVFDNITERKEAEQKIKDSEEKYRLLIETAVMGIVEFDIEKKLISYINPKLLEILDYSKEDLLVEKMLLKIIHPEDLKELIELRENKYVEFRVFTKDGKLKWLSGTRNNRFNQEGKLISARLWLQDTTESKEVEEIKSNLLTRFSHEFKTPLISIKGFADFLLTEYKVKFDEKTLSFLKRIKEGSDRLQILINSFVESSQLDKSIIQVNLGEENLYDLIAEALDELEGLIHMREHEIDMNIGKKLILHVDKEKVYTVITNLLINAINYTQKGGIILIQSKIDKKSIVISIKDNGIGLDETEIISLFKPFGKIERYGKGWDIVIGGMGMGLFISKEIIELHGGKIWVESEGRNKGSTFFFSIPITK